MPKSLLSLVEMHQVGSTRLFLVHTESEHRGWSTHYECDSTELLEEQDSNSVEVKTKDWQSQLQSLYACKLHSIY